jgi:hypothetical protein
MRIKIDTDVTAEPIDTTYLKEYLNQLEAWTSTESTALGIMISAARELCEEFTEMALAAKTVTVFFSQEEVIDNGRYMELPLRPHSSITKVYSINAEGTETPLTVNQDYYVRGIRGAEFEIYIPETVATIGAEVSVTDYNVTYVCGYSSPGCEAIPKSLKTIMGTIIKGWWGNRDSWVPVLSEEFKMALLPFKKTRF